MEGFEPVCDYVWRVFLVFLAESKGPLCITDVFLFCCLWVFLYIPAWKLFHIIMQSPDPEVHSNSPHSVRLIFLGLRDKQKHGCGYPTTSWRLVANDGMQEKMGTAALLEIVYSPLSIETTTWDPFLHSLP